MDGRASGSGRISAQGRDAGRQGQELFDSVGCRACHAYPRRETRPCSARAKDFAPNLGNVAQKESGRFIYWWIKNPRGWN